MVSPSTMIFIKKHTSSHTWLVLLCIIPSKCVAVGVEGQAKPRSVLSLLVAFPWPVGGCAYSNESVSFCFTVVWLLPNYRRAHQ